MAKLKQPIVELSSDITFAELIEIEKTTPRRSDEPRSLSIDDIHLADQVFQLRKDFQRAPQANRDHIRTLMGALRDGAVLDPVLVTAVGDKFYLVDGHHRFLAYKSLEWKRPVPVKIFPGSVAEAELEAGCENHKDKLSVSKESKLEHAWTLVNRDTHSIAKIIMASGVSQRTINNMRVKRREIIERGEEPAEVAWKYAKRDTVPDGDFERDKWIETKASELAKRICEDKSLKVVQWPEVLVRAIEMVSNELPRRMIECWPEAVMDLAGLLEQDQEELEAMDI